MTAPPPVELVATSSARVRQRLRVLMAVVLISFVLLWAAALFDLHQRSASRQLIAEQVMPAAQALQRLNHATHMAEQLVTRAIGESDAFLLEDARGYIEQGQQERTLLQNWAATRPSLRSLLQSWAQFSAESLQLASELIEHPDQLPRFVERAQARQTLRQALFAALDAEMRAAEAVLRQNIDNAARQSERNVWAGGALLLVLLIAVVLAVRLVGRTVASFAHRLRRQAREFAALYNETPAMLMTSDMQDRCTAVSDFFVRETGLAREAILNQPIQQFLHQQHTDRRHLGTSARWDEYEAELRLADGERRDVLVRTRPMPDGEMRALNVLVDITERKRARRDLEELNNTLEQRVHERTAELTDVNQQLVEAMDRLQAATRSLVEAEKLAALGSLVAGVAHELNTPIGSVLTATSHLAMEIKSLREAVQSGLRRAQLERFIEQADEATAIGLRNLERSISLIQSFKQVAVDQTSEQRRRFNLKSSLEEILMTLKPQLRAGGHEVELQAEDDIVMDSYPGPLMQIISNLVSNAVIHAFAGREHGRILIMARKRDAQSVRLGVADNGRGMSEEQRRRCFEPFYTTRLGQGGSGLGLSIVYNLATGVLGGEVTVINAAEGGCEFEFELPLTAPPTAAPSTSGMPA